MKSICFAGFLMGVVALGAPPVSTNVTFNKDVLPIMQKNCQNCHRPNQIAPMSFLSYKEVRPWAKAIKAVVISRKMPPWMATPETSKNHPLANDRNLKQSDIDTFAAWADGGAPEGDPKDKPAPVQFADDGWLMGPPDVIFKLKPMTLPVAKRGANGLVEDRIPMVDYILPTNFTQDMWLSAVQIKPGNRAVVHHGGVDAAPVGSPWYAKAGMEPGQGYFEQERPRPQANAPVANVANTVVATNATEVFSLGGFSPGHELVRYNTARSDAGRLLPAGSWLRVQIHYTSSGLKPEVDETEIGMWFLKETAHHRYTQISVSDPKPTKDGIPWGEANLEVKRSATVQKPFEVSLFMPHMHWRGTDMTYRAIYPTGETDTMLKVENFSFDWQLPYELTKPIPLPTGTKIELTAHYNNSPSKLDNPYVGEKTEWGDQTWNEMFIGFMGVLIPANSSSIGLFKMDKVEAQ
jgi:hypothetical protein